MEKLLESAGPRVRLAGSWRVQYPTKAGRRKYAPFTGARKLTFLSRLFGEKKERARLLPLYRAVVEAGRRPAWYEEGGVPDSVDGRFDMIASLLSLVLLRLEHEGEVARAPSVLLTETFIDDMDSSLRQIGIGDFVVGKHIGRMMSALGGRMEAYRAAGDGGDLDGAVRRNVFHDSPPSPEALAFVTAGLRRFEKGLEGLGLEQILAGELPPP